MVIQNVMSDESVKKLAKNHVPTCPIIAGLVTVYIIPWYIYHTEK